MKSSVSKATELHPSCNTGQGENVASEFPGAELVVFDPKDSELCLAGVKPVETRVEALSDSDVQIDRLSWV